MDDGWCGICEATTDGNCCHNGCDECGNPCTCSVCTVKKLETELDALRQRAEEAERERDEYKAHLVNAGVWNELKTRAENTELRRLLKESADRVVALTAERDRAQWL